MGATVEEAMVQSVEAAREWAEVTEARGDRVPAPRTIEDLRRDGDVAAALAEGATLVSVPLVRQTGRPAKANLSLDAGVLAAIDEEAARRKLTRSAFIEVMAKHMLALS
jgi:hypothetical protein